MLWSDTKEQNSVKQLFFNSKINKLKCILLLLLETPFYVAIDLWVLKEQYKNEENLIVHITIIWYSAWLREHISSPEYKIIFQNV